MLWRRSRPRSASGAEALAIQTRRLEEKLDRLIAAGGA